MSAADRRGPMTIAISTSDTPDLAAMGLSEGHLNEAAAELAVQLLAYGANLAYGGDLRANGFARLLSRLVLRYTPTSELKDGARVTKPPGVARTHQDAGTTRIEQLAADLRGRAELILLACDGTRVAMDARRKLATREPTEEEWRYGLTAMREDQRSSTDARVLLRRAGRGVQGPHARVGGRGAGVSARRPAGVPDRWVRRLYARYRRDPRAR